MRLYVLGAVPILRLVLLGMAVVLIVPLVINPTMQNLFVIFGAAGVAIGFAFKDYVSSLIAGIVAVTERPYRPGDWVKVDDAYGEVKSVGLRSIRIVTPDDTVVTIPHLKLWDTNIYNANDGAPTLQCVADFYLEPQHDAALVRRTLRDVALTSAYLQLERPIAVIVAEKAVGDPLPAEGLPDRCARSVSIHQRSDRARKRSAPIFKHRSRPVRRFCASREISLTSKAGVDYRDSPVRLKIRRSRCAFDGLGKASAVSGVLRYSE